MMMSLCLCYETICLMTKASSKFAVLLQHFFWRMKLLVIASTMSSYLRCACALSSNLL